MHIYSTTSLGSNTFNFLVCEPSLPCFLFRPLSYIRQNSSRNRAQGSSKPKK